MVELCLREHFLALRLIEQLEEGDGERGGAEPVGDEDAAEIFVEAEFDFPEISFRRQSRRVEFL